MNLSRQILSYIFIVIVIFWSLQSCKFLHHSFIRKFYSEAQFGVVDKSIETDFRSTSSDKNCHQIWQQLQRQGQGATKKRGYSSEKL